MQASGDQPQHLVVWDEMLADVGSHHGLLQAYSVHCAPPVFDGKTNTAFASSLEQKEAEISAVGRTCTNLDMERVNAVSNCMLSMADTNAHGIFDEMPVLAVVWDEELQHMRDDQHDLLKELAQGGECHVVENKLMVMGSMDEPTHNTGAPMLLELGMASVDVIYDEMPQLDVVWDVGPLHNIDSHDALVQHEAQFDECSVVDNDITGDLVISDLLTHDNDTFLTEFDMGSANKLSNHLPLGVIWDEEFEHGQSSHGLLRHIALSADYLVGEKPNAEPHTYDVLTHVSVSPYLLELGIEAMHQSAEIHREDNHATVPECVEFTDHITSSGDAQEAFASIHNDREATSLTDEGAFYSCKVSECAAVKVFNKTTLPDVVWDHEPQHGPKSHGLLLQLASGEECLVGMDNKLIAELVTFKLAGSRESIDGEKAKGVIMADTDKVLTHIGGLSHFLEICETSNADEEGKLVAEILIHESGLLQYPEISVTEFSPQYLNAQVIDDQMHNKHIDFNTSVLFDYDALNMISKISWADILRAIVEFDVNEKLAMDRECLNGENMIFDAGIDALCSSDLVCLSSQFRNHINCHHNEKMLLSENYILYHPVGPRKYYGVHTSVFLSFASSCRTYSSSLRSQCSGLRLEDMAIGLLRRGVFVYCLEKYRFDAAYLLLGNLSSFSDLSQCSNDTGYVLNKVPAWCNNGFSPRANAQLGVPKIRYFHGWYFGQVKEEASEFVGQCPLFSSGQKHVKQKSIWNMSWSYGRVQNCSLSDIFMTERPEGSSAGALHNTQRLSHVDYGIVDRDFKYIGISALSNSATCPIRQWDPGGNPDCFIPAIAWGQAMFCGGGKCHTRYYWLYGLRYHRLWASWWAAKLHSRIDYRLAAIKERGGRWRRKTEDIFRNRVSSGSRASSSFSRSFTSISPVICSRRRVDLTGGHGLLQKAGWLPVPGNNFQ